MIILMTERNAAHNRTQYLILFSLVLSTSYTIIFFGQYIHNFTTIPSHLYFQIHHEHPKKHWTGQPPIIPKSPLLRFVSHPKINHAFHHGTRTGIKRTSTLRIPVTSRMAERKNDKMFRTFIRNFRGRWPILQRDNGRGIGRVVWLCGFLQKNVGWSDGSCMWLWRLCGWSYHVHDIIKC